MYIVEWCDEEGNLHQKDSKRMHDAKAEMKYLKSKFGWASIKKGG